jgi:signal transduction histidine kinase
MSAKLAERALEPFFTTKDVGRGTGLGLSQVYGKPHQSRGAVRIESAPGIGTTVRFYLRRAEIQPRRADELSAR